MLAARYIDSETPFRITEVDRQTPGEHEVVVDLEVASLCGTDLHYLDPSLEYSPDRTPLTLGHEGAGTVAATGPAVTTVETGQRVFVNYVIGCGNCTNCVAGYDNRCLDRRSVGHDVDGTFAESVVLPEGAVVAMGQDIPMEWGSLTSCAVSTGFHAINRADIDGGDVVLITGAGGVGLSTVMWADFLGAAEIIVSDPVRQKLGLAKQLGADRTVDPSSTDITEYLDTVGSSRGIDVAIECSGSRSAMASAVGAVSGKNQFSSGRVVSVGLQEDPIEIPYWGLREGQCLVSGDHTRAELLRIVDILDRKQVDPSPLLTHRVSLETLDNGIEILRDPDEPVGRIAVTIP